MKIIPVIAATLALSVLAISIWAYAPEVSENESDWIMSAAMPTARSEIAAAVLGQHIYVAGGIAPTTSDAFERYNVLPNQWEKLTPLPAKRHHVAMAALNGEIYAVGGFSNLGFKAAADSWKYSPTSGQWQSVASLPEPRGEHAMVAADGSLLIFAGSSPRSQEVWQYNASNDSWEVFGKPMPTFRDSTAVVLLGDEVWVIGGRSKAAGDMTIVEIFNINTGQWRNGPALPAPRAGHAAALIAGRIVVFGGESLASATVFAEVFEYDPSQGDQASWQLIGKLPYARHGLAGASMPERAFAIGGGYRAGLRTPLSLSSDITVLVNKSTVASDMQPSPQ